MALQSFERQSYSPFIIWAREYIALNDGDYITSADGSLDLVIMEYDDKRRFMISGPTTKARKVTYKEGTKTMVLRLKPGIHVPHIPAAELLDVDNFLPSANKHSFWLQGQQLRFPDFDNAESFVDKLFTLGILRLDGLMEAFLAGKAPLTATRTIQRRFLATTGLTPHYIVQIQRADKAEQLLAQGMSIQNVVHEAGFYDQPHMTHSLKYFIGRTPIQIKRTPDGWQ